MGDQQSGIMMTTADVHASNDINLIIDEPEQAADHGNDLNQIEEPEKVASVPEHTPTIIMPVSPPEASNDASEIMNLFGHDPSVNTKLGNVMLDGIATRWTHLLTKGLDLEKKQKLVDQYLPAQNCAALLAPILNEELATSLNENKVREDKYLSRVQAQMAAGLMALYEPINALVSKKSTDDQLLQKLADSTKLFTDVFHQLSLHRRFLLSSWLNPQYKKCLENQPIDKYLYGEDLLEKVKQSREATSAAFKVGGIVKQKHTTQINHLNYRGQLNKPKFKQDLRQEFKPYQPQKTERRTWQSERGKNRQFPGSDRSNKPFKKQTSWRTRKN